MQFDDSCLVFLFLKVADQTLLAQILLESGAPKGLSRATECPMSLQAGCSLAQVAWKQDHF